MGTQALTLDTWNVDELQASDDYVDLQFGTFDGNTTITLQWVGGADDTSGALASSFLDSPYTDDLARRGLLDAAHRVRKRSLQFCRFQAAHD